MRRAAAAVMATLAMTLGAGMFAVRPAAADTSQASNFNIGVMSPGEDQSTLNGFERCTGTQGVFNQGYYAFPSKDSTVDNGLQTDIGNDQGMLKLTFDLPSSVNSGTIDVSAPNPPRPANVPGSAPWGTGFPANTGVVNPGAAALYGCNMSASTVPAGSQFLTYYYVISIKSGSTTYFNFPGGVTTNSTAPNQVGIPFNFPAGTSSSSVTVYIADVVNPTEGTYAGVNYTVSVEGSTSLPAPAQDTVSYVASSPDPETSTLTSSLTTTNPDLTATNIPSDGAVLTATINDAFYNPIQGESVFIGVQSGSGAETSPIGSTSSGGSGEPTTGSNGQAQYYAFGTTATPPGDPDLFFAQDTTSNIFVENSDGSLATVAIPIVAADPNPPSEPGSGSSITVTGGSFVTPQHTQVTADGTSSATVTIELEDQFGNADSNQAIILQPVEPTPPSPSESFKHVVVTPLDPPAAGAPCTQGPSSQIPGISCTDDTGTASFSVTDTLAQSVAFEVTDLTDGDSLPDLDLPADDPNIPIVDFLPGPTSATTSTVSVDGGQTANVLANGTSAATVQVNLVDAEGNAEVGKVVTLAGNSGTSSTITAITPAAESDTLTAEGCPIPTPGTTDCNGNAYFSVSDSTVESVTYTATDTTDSDLVLNNPGQQPVVNFITGAVSAANSTVSASPPTVVGDGQGVSTVTVTALDGGNHALDGETVTIDPSAYPSITIVPGSATTDANGEATFKVRSSSPLGAVSLPVTVGSTVLAATADITFTNPPYPAHTSVTSSPPNSPTAPEATGSPDVTVTVSVADSSDTAIPGLLVELLANGSPLTPTSTTDGSGIATFSVGAFLPGPVTYTAIDLSDNDRTLGTTVVDYVPIPDEAHESTVTASPAATYTFESGQPASSQTSTVKVTLLDSTGSPIVGDTVQLGASSTNAVVTAVDGGISNSRGVATFTVSDPDPESVVFQATDEATSTPIVETASVNFVLRPNENTTSTITASPTVVSADGKSSTTITVTLQNNGVLLQGNTVSLSQGTGASIITTTDPVSNASGQVVFTATDLTPQSVAYQATDLTTATELTHDAVVTFTASSGSQPPSVTSIDPTSGPGSGGTQVVITGTNLAGATAVDFGTVAAPTFSIDPSGTEIIATSPVPLAAGTVNVTATNDEGTSAAVAGDEFTYTSSPPLVVSSVTPSAGSVKGGTKVTITGSDLASASSVSFGGVAATFTRSSDGSKLVAVAPAATAGRVDVVVTAGGSASTAGPMDQFLFRNPAPVVPPTILSISPASGSPTGGTLVTIHGTNLRSLRRVEFGSAKATDVTVSPSGEAVTLRTPPHSVGTVRVAIQAKGGASHSVANDRFSYVTPGLTLHRFSRSKLVFSTSKKGSGGALGAGASKTVAMTGHAGVPATAKRVLLEVTATARTASTSVGVLPAGSSSGGTSFAVRKGRTVTKELVVSVGKGGAISLTNAGGTTAIAVRVVGYYTTARVPAARTPSSSAQFQQRAARSESQGGVLR